MSVKQLQRIRMPNRNSAYYENISPEIDIEGLDEKTVSLVITLDDMGHPIPPGFNHWVAWNIPPVVMIPENIPKGASVEHPIHMEQGIAYVSTATVAPSPHFTGSMIISSLLTHLTPLFV